MAADVTASSFATQTDSLVANVTGTKQNSWLIVSSNRKPGEDDLLLETSIL